MCFDMRQALSCVKENMQPSIAYELTAANAIVIATDEICKQAHSMTIKRWYVAAVGDILTVWLEVLIGILQKGQALLLLCQLAVTPACTPESPHVSCRSLRPGTAAPACVQRQRRAKKAEAGLLMVETWV